MENSSTTFPTAQIVSLADRRAAKKQTAEATAVLKPPQRKKAGAWYASLSFVKKRKGDGLDFWAVEPSGNYTADYKRGEQLGHEFMDYLVASGPTNGNAVLLSWIANRMTEKGDTSGLALGFMKAIGRVSAALICSCPEIVDASRNSSA